MPLSKHCKDRYEVEAKFPYGEKLKHKETGAIWYIEKRRDVYSAVMVCMNPMGRAAMQWRNILEDFEVAADGR